MSEVKAHNRDTEHWFIVFDPKDGRVVHTHQVIVPADAEDRLDAHACESLARAAASEQLEASPALRMMVVSSRQRLDPEMTYRVDIESGRLIEHANPRLAALKARR